MFNSNTWFINKKATYHFATVCTGCPNKPKKGSLNAAVHIISSLSASCASQRRNSICPLPSNACRASLGCLLQPPARSPSNMCGCIRSFALALTRVELWLRPMVGLPSLRGLVHGLAAVRDMAGRADTSLGLSKWVTLCVGRPASLLRSQLTPSRLQECCTVSTGVSGKLLSSITSYSCCLATAFGRKHCDMGEFSICICKKVWWLLENFVLSLKLSCEPRVDSAGGVTFILP